MFSMYQDAIYATRAFEAGALGYLSKASAPELLVEAVRCVAPDSATPARTLPRRWPRARRRRPDWHPHCPAREHEILRLLSRGYALGEIGERLGVSPKTVANQQWSIKQKLGATSALQLILIARELGLD